MNIVLINPEYPSSSTLDHGGIATYVYTMANALAALGNRVFVLAREGTCPDQLSPSITFQTFSHTHVRSFFSLWEKKVNGSLFWEKGCSQGALNVVLSIHKQYPIDVVEIPEYTGVAYRFKKTLPFPVVITFHTPSALVDELNNVQITPKHKKYYAYEKQAVENGVAFRCPSRSLALKAGNLFSIPPERITIIQNPIPVTSPSFPDTRDTKHRTTFDILFAGRLEQRKGAEVILKTIKNILEIDPSIQLTFAGETTIAHTCNYREAIENALTPENRKRIWFIGPIDRYSLAMLFRRSDAFFMPSLFENSPYSLLEAMAAGLPVVGTHTSGISEIIRHKITGLLFPPDSPDQVSVCFRELFTQPLLRETIARNALEYVKQFHSTSVIARKTVEWYTSISSQKTV
jgi:glycosyltransferase involved in cell wall biosynthesis